MALPIDNLNRDIYYSEPIKNSVGKGIKSLLGRIGPNNKKLIDNLKIVKENIFTFQTYIFSTKKNEISDELLDYTKDLTKVETNIINEDRLNRIIDHISYFVNIENYNIDNITHLLDKDKISIDKYIENYNLDPNKQEVDKIIFTEKEKLDINTELMFNNVQKAYFLINNGTIKYIGYYKKLIKNIKSKELEEQKKQQDIYESQLEKQAKLQTEAMAIFQKELENRVAATKSTELGQPNARIAELEKQLAAATATKEALNAKIAAETATKDGKIVQLEKQLAAATAAKIAAETAAKGPLNAKLAAATAEKEALEAKLAAATKPIEPVNDPKIKSLEEELAKIKEEKKALEAKIPILDNSAKISVKSGVNPKKEDIIQLILFLSESRLEIEKLKLESKKVAGPESESITAGINMKPSVNMKPGVNMKPSVNMKPGINMKEISRIIDAYKNIGSSGPNDTGKKESFEKLITEYKETYKLNTKIKAILESIKL
jgi:hypothetical protein